MDTLIAAFASVVVSVFVAILLWERRLDDQRRLHEDRLRFLEEKILHLQADVGDRIARLEANLRELRKETSRR